MNIYLFSMEIDQTIMPLVFIFDLIIILYLIPELMKEEKIEKENKKND